MYLQNKQVYFMHLIDLMNFVNLKKVLKTMSEKEQLVIQLYYFEELSLKEISEILGVTESRISQIHKKILRKIREKLNG